MKKENEVLKSQRSVLNGVIGNNVLLFRYELQILPNRKHTAFAYVFAPVNALSRNHYKPF
jgi:hypothetical protein